MYLKKQKTKNKADHEATVDLFKSSVVGKQQCYSICVAPHTSAETCFPKVRHKGVFWREPGICRNGVQVFSLILRGEGWLVR